VLYYTENLPQTATDQEVAENAMIWFANRAR
jgi:hypothetical protein